MKWYFTVLKKYAVFKGRARRKEYWYFQFFDLIFFILSIIISYYLAVFFNQPAFISIFYIYVIALIIPRIAVTVRRLHDTGNNGLMIFLLLIPLIDIWIGILMVTDSKYGDNKYGPNPKGEFIEQELSVPETDLPDPLSI
jgi:uncharacterized membrane protein YhaH (DUF805 family)